MTVVGVARAVRPRLEGGQAAARERVCCSSFCAALCGQQGSGKDVSERRACLHLSDAKHGMLRACWLSSVACRKQKGTLRMLW